MCTRFAMRGICKNFGATVALDGVDFAVSSGEIHALIGENGAGKSTLMNALSGALQPDAGEMRVDDVPFAPANPMHARQQGVAMVYQELSLAPPLIVGTGPRAVRAIQSKKASGHRVSEAFVLGATPVQKPILTLTRCTLSKMPNSV